MAQILDPLPSSDLDVALCCYVNATSKIQVARITNIPDWYFERVVFPGQRLMFEAAETALLEIHTGMMASSILSDTIPCRRLMMASSVTTPVVMPTETVDTQGEKSIVSIKSVSNKSVSKKPVSNKVENSSEALPVGAVVSD